MYSMLSNKCVTWYNDYHTPVRDSLIMSAGVAYLWNAGCGLRAISAFSLMSLGGTLVNYLFHKQEKIHAHQLIVITGCDSGLGYSLALHCRKMGAMVLVGVLKPELTGAANLTTNGIMVLPLDLTNRTHIKDFKDQVEVLLKKEKLELYAFVNNAGVMVFGEFEWQTEKQIRQQMMVNTLGAMLITQDLMPIIRANKSRIIIISSHCAEESLPGLSVYGASKAALLAWATSLRLELFKHGIHVISFVPGNFVTQSNIMARQKEHFKDMERRMTREAKEFYGDYFNQYSNYFSSIAGPEHTKPLTDQKIYNTFNRALLDIYPKAVYKCQPLRYFFYFTLFKRMPTWMRDKLVHRFVRGPLN